MKVQKDQISRVCEYLGLDLNSAPCKQVQDYLESSPNCKTFVENIKKTVRVYQVAEHGEKLSEATCRKLLTNLNLEEPNHLNKE